MPEFYIKYQWPNNIRGFEPGYDISYESIDKADTEEVFLTDKYGKVMVFESENHALVQIMHEKTTDWEFARWAKDISVIKGETLIIEF